jgi:hypothetical protein
VVFVVVDDDGGDVAVVEVVVAPTVAVGLCALIISPGSKNTLSALNMDKKKNAIRTRFFFLYIFRIFFLSFN